ncbi:MAG: hypothetical protein PVJ76_13060 [Gemmatimonadota bacterium]|jgi:serine/threonine-protein kinase
MPTPSLLQRLKERKLVQWALAYLAGAFVVFQLLDALEGALGLTPAIQRAVLVVVGMGFFITLVIAWYHGEKGRQRASGPELLMVAALLVVAGVALTLVPGRDGDSGEGRRASPTPTGDDRPGIAVLPCANHSPDPEDAYLAPSIHDEILLKLGSISAIRSMGRETVEWYRENPLSPAEMARDLGVGFVGECSVQNDPSRDQVRLRFQLMDASGAQVWVQDYVRDLSTESLFAIQSDIAQQVALEMEAILTPEEREQIEARTTESLEAYEYYLRGNERLWQGWEETDNRIAVQMYERAIAADSAFALAYAQLATANCRIWWYHQDRTERPREVARAAIDRATTLNPGHPKVQQALGYYHYWCWMEYGPAADALSRSLAGGSSTRGHSGLAFVERRQGKWEEALGHLRTAASLDPQSCTLADEVALTLTLLRRYQEAEEGYERGLQMCPDFAGLYYENTNNYVQWDRGTERAWDVIAAAEELGVMDSDLAFQAVHLEILDRNYEQALARLEEVSWEVDENQQFKFFPKSLWYARVYDWMGRRDLAEVHYEAARAALEPLIAEAPEDSRLYSSLGAALAGLGHREAAIEAATTATQLMPLNLDAWRGARRALDLAEVLAVVGDRETAIDELEGLLSIPSPISVGLLLLDPIWDPLRDHPRFQALLEDHGH